MEAQGWKRLSQRAFGSPRQHPRLEMGLLGPGLHSSMPRSLERRCDPFLVTGLSLAEVETSVFITLPRPLPFGSPDRLGTICPGQRSVW